MTTNYLFDNAAEREAGQRMAALSGLLGWPLARVGSHHAVARGMSLIVGCVSTGLGIYYGSKILGF